MIYGGRFLKLRKTSESRQNKHFVSAQCSGALSYGQKLCPRKKRFGQTDGRTKPPLTERRDLNHKNVNITFAIFHHLDPVQTLREIELPKFKTKTFKTDLKCSWDRFTENIKFNNPEFPIFASDIG